MMNTFRLIAAAFLTAAVSGCATAPPDDGFAPVRQVVADRTGRSIRWNQSREDDARVQAAVAGMLRTPLTAETSVQIALLNNPDLQAAFEDLGIARADQVQAGLLKNPVLDLSVRIPDRRPSRTYLDIDAAEDFLDLFLIPARRRLAAAEFERVRDRVTDDVLRLAAETRAAFYRYQAADRIVALRETSARAAAAAIETAERLRQAGNITEMDALAEQARDARASIELTEAREQAMAARERLDRLMGLTEDAGRWKCAGDLPRISTTEPSADDLESVAVRRRLDLSAARQEIRVEAAALGLAGQSRFLSSADLGPEFERETDGQWRIGPTLSIPLPLFDQGQAVLARHRALLRQDERKYAAMLVTVRSEVRSAIDRMHNARERAVAYRDSVLPLESRLLHAMQLQYNGMSVSIFQLLQARRDQLEAEERGVEATADCLVAQAELERAIGGRIPRQPATAPSHRDQP